MSEHGFPRVLILRVKRHELLVRERVIVVDHVLADLLVLQEDVSIPLLALLDGGRGHGRVPVGAPEVVDVLSLLRASNVFLERAQVSPAIRRDLVTSWRRSSLCRLKFSSVTSMTPALW